MPRKPDPTAYYRLTNHYTGPSAPLSVYREPNDPHIYLTTATGLSEKRPSTTTPYWQFFPVYNSSPPKYHILTEYADPDTRETRFLALDIFNADKSVPHLTKPGWYSGQYWRLESWEEDGDGLEDVRLTNDYSGQELHLDTYSGSKKGFLGDGDHTGQHWVVEKVKKPVGRKEGVTGRKEREWGSGAGGVGFGVGFGAAVVLALAWGEVLPLVLVGGLALGGGVLVGRKGKV